MRASVLDYAASQIQAHAPQFLPRDNFRERSRSTATHNAIADALLEARPPDAPPRSGQGRESLTRRYAQPRPFAGVHLAWDAGGLVVDRRPWQGAGFEGADRRCVINLERREPAAQHQGNLVDQHVADGAEFALEAIAVAQQPGVGECPAVGEF